MMTPRLADLASCFEGVIPSVIATRAADGMPNISYLSHVAMVDDEHVALSNQFFAKTAANIRSDPHASVLVVCPRTGRQYQLALTWQRSAEHGVLFDHMAAHLRASSAQIGMADVMRLRAIDIFRVEAISPLAAPSEQQPPSAHPAPTLNDLAPALRDLSAQTDPAGVMDLLLSLIRDKFGYQHAMVLLNEPDRTVVTAAASIGYGQSGVGAEVPHGVGLIGAAAASARSMRINDVSRVRRMGGAVAATSGEDEVASRRVTLPGFADAMSQIAVPMSVQGQVRGVLFVESPDRLAFDNQAAAALEMLAQQAASALALNERLADEADEPHASEPPLPADDRQVIEVLHHPFDHSIFIDHVYVIKGVAGQILMHMLDQYRQAGRADFSNREIRVSMGTTLPEFKDNLETRLLLLRRRLDELKLPIRLHHVGRGLLRLETLGEVVATST